MKILSLLLPTISLVAIQALAEPSSEASTADRISSMVKAGEVYQLETIAPLIDAPDRVTVLEFGPKSWVLVEYEASVLTPGELLPRARKGKMWVNFDQVVAARKVMPGEATAPAPPAPGPAATAATQTPAPAPAPPAKAGGRSKK